MTQCAILVPRMEMGDMGKDRCATECDQPAGHLGPHSFLGPRGRVEWEDDWDCDCCTPEDRLSDGCFVWRVVA